MMFRPSNRHPHHQSYREAIESGGLPSDSWELGVAHKCLAGHFFKQRMYAASAESYGEATSIFEWHMDNAEGSEAKNRDVIQCYEHLLEIGDEDTCPMSEDRADLCYKLANCYVQANRHAGELHEACESDLPSLQILTPAQQKTPFLCTGKPL